MADMQDLLFSLGQVQKTIIQMKLRPLFLIIPLPVILQQGKRKSSVSYVMRRQPGIFSVLWLCWKVKEERE